MKKITSLLFVITIFSSIVFAQKNYRPLFRIYENGLYGYIDSTGTVIIPPKYKGAGEFSEGLAPVRENGYYGYIDETGKYAIAPQYDYAERIINGLGVIYKKRKAGILKKNGTILLPFKFQNIEILDNGMAVVTTETNMKGLINRNGNLIIDTSHFKISEFNDGIATALKENVKKWQDNAGAFDSTGKIVVPFGKYNRIGPFRNGYAKVRWTENNETNSFWGYVNKKGEIVFTMNDSTGWESSDYVTKEGYFNADYYEHGVRDKVNWRKNKLLCGIMNFNGELVKKDSVCLQYDFYENKLCIKDEFGRFKTLNNVLEPDGKYFFLDRANFKQYLSIRDSNGLYGLVDTSMQFILKPTFDMVYENTLIEDYLLYKNKQSNKIGVCRINGEFITDPIFDNVEMNGFMNSLLLFKKNGLAGYLDKNGNIIWQQSQNIEKLKMMNIDYQITNNYRIDESSTWQPEIIGSTDSIHRDIKGENFQIMIDENENLVFLEKFRGNALYIINNSDNMILSSSLDACLPMVIQAHDEKGKWRDIENNDRQFCVMSESIIRFKSKTYWKFAIPTYHGGFQTKLRVRIEILNDNNERKNIYSNEISGSINPAQFWRNVGWFNHVNLLER
jgi:hypothetical protein